MTLGDYVQQFLDAKRAKSQKTFEFYRVGLSQFLDFTSTDIWPITDSEINAFLADCRARKLKQNTVFAYFRAIRSMFIWLEKRHVITHEQNPIYLVEKPDPAKKLPRAPKKEALQKLFTTIREAGGWLAARDLCIFGLLLDTGLRIGELASLTVDDVDLDNNEIFIDEQFTKSSASRIVVFTDKAKYYLACWLEYRSMLEFRLPPELNALFVSYWRGEWRTFTEDGIRQAKDAWLKRAGLSRFRVHDLRHAFAIYKLRNGGDLQDISDQLGHVNIATTAIYLKADGSGRRKRHEDTSALNDI